MRFRPKGVMVTCSKPNHGRSPKLWEVFTSRATITSVDPVSSCVGEVSHGKHTFNTNAKLAIFVETGFWSSQQFVDRDKHWCVPLEITFPAAIGTSVYWTRVPIPMGPSWTFCGIVR